MLFQYESQMEYDETKFTYDDMFRSELVRMVFGTPRNKKLHPTGDITRNSGQLVWL